MDAESHRILDEIHEFYQKNPQALWDNLIEWGFIDSQGRVLLDGDTGVRNQIYPGRPIAPAEPAQPGEDAS